jgi:hypothetical protein
LPIVMASGSVNWAGLIGDFIFGHPFEGIVGFTSVATIISTAGDQDLGGYINVWPSCVSCDLNSIRQCGSGSMSPAWSAILWNMLVSKVG